MQETTTIRPMNKCINRVDLLLNIDEYLVIIIIKSYRNTRKIDKNIL